MNGRGAAPWFVLILFFASSFFVSLLSVDDGDIKEATLLHRYTTTTTQNQKSSNSISSKIFQSFKKKEKHEFTPPWLKNNQNWKTILTKTTNHSVTVSVIYYNEKSTIEQYEIEIEPFVKGINSNDVWIFKRKIDIDGRIIIVQTTKNQCLTVLYNKQKNQKMKRFGEVICEKENYKIEFPGNAEVSTFEQSLENQNCFYYSTVFDEYKFRYICKNEFKNESFNGPLSTDESYLISIQQKDESTIFGLNLIQKIEFGIHRYHLEIMSFTKKLNETNQFETVKFRRKSDINLQTTKMNIVRKSKNDGLNFFLQKEHSKDLITVCPFDRYILIIEKLKATLFDFSPYHESYQLKNLKTTIDEKSKYISIINGYKTIYIIEKEDKWSFKRAIIRRYKEVIINSIFFEYENKSYLLVFYKDGSIGSFDFGDSNGVSSFLFSKWKIIFAIVAVISVFIWNEINIRRRLQRQQNQVPLQQRANTQNYVPPMTQQN
eukprot:gene2970-4980_t